MSPSQIGRIGLNGVGWWRSSPPEGSSPRAPEAAGIIWIRSHDGKTTVLDNLDVKGRATVQCTRLRQGSSWMPFRLHSTPEVDSIQDARSRPVSNYRPEESSDVWVYLSANHPVEETRTFFCHRDLLDPFRNLWIELRSYNLWFQVYQADRPTQYRIPFDTPDR